MPEAMGGAIYNVFVMDVGGANPTPLTNMPAGGFALPGPISPDDTGVLVQARTGGLVTAEILRASLNTFSVLNLTNNSVNDAGGIWSPSGERIAFQSRRDAATDEIYVNKNGENSLATIRPKRINSPAIDITRARSTSRS